jgi:4-diphosphocytidyl-2-C-methyl-D-erythritol kinase
VSTPAVYRALDELAGEAADGINDLEPAALVVEPRLRWWREAIRDRLGTAPTLAGSGATWFVEGDHQDAVGDLTDEGAAILRTRTIDAGRAQGAQP